MTGKDFIKVRMSTSVSRKRKIILPYVGKANEDDSICKALRLNYQLFTQCTNKAMKNRDFCKICLKYVEADGSTPYGTIEDRMKCGILDYVDPSGKKALPLHRVIKRMKLTREEMEEECKLNNIIIPPEHWGEENAMDMNTDETHDVSHDESATTISPSPTSTPKKSLPKISVKGRPKKEYTYVNESDIQQKEFEELQMKINDIPTASNDMYSNTEIEVECISVDNKEFLVSREGMVYDIDTEEDIGMLKIVDGEYTIEYWEYEDE